MAINFDEIRDLKLYKKMYLHLLNGVIDVCDICKDPVAVTQLIKLQQEVENIFIDGEPD